MDAKELQVLRPASDSVAAIRDALRRMDDAKAAAEARLDKVRADRAGDVLSLTAEQYLALGEVQMRAEFDLAQLAELRAAVAAKLPEAEQRERFALLKARRAELLAERDALLTEARAEYPAIAAYVASLLQRMTAHFARCTAFAAAIETGRAEERAALSFEGLHCLLRTDPDKAPGPFSLVGHAVLPNFDGGTFYFGPAAVPPRI